MNMQDETGVSRIALSGRITAENAEELSSRIDAALSRRPEMPVVFDAESLDYISGTGLRKILRAIRASRFPVRMENVSPEVHKMLELTGFTRLMEVRMRLREISTEGCEVIGAGRSSCVFRLDQETILKRYEPDVPLSMIEEEMRLAREAFVDGIPTAIPFDLVRVGERYGVVFEMIRAETVGRTILDHPERMEEITRRFVALLRQLHSTHRSPGSGYRDVKLLWGGWLEGMRDAYTPAETDLMRSMLEAVPPRDTLVHNDFHENNVMDQQGEMVLIDMANIAYGHPIFDLAGGAFRAHVSYIPGREAHHGLPPEQMNAFWRLQLREYFAEEDPERLRSLGEMCDAFGFLRSALFPMKHPEISARIRQLHIDDARKTLLCRPEWAMEQARRVRDAFPAPAEESVRI